MQGQFDSVGTGTVFPRFYMDSVQDEVATAAEGRAIFRDVERVEIFMPGNALSRPVKNVADEHRMRWPQEYQAFKENRELTTEGTPLEQWAMLTKSQVMELKALHFRSVEDIARMTDTQIQQFRIGGMRLRECARAFLDDAAANALTTKMTHDNEQLLSEIAVLRQQNENMKSQLDQLFAERQVRLNALDPILTAVPGMSDPAEAARQQTGQAQLQERAGRAVQTSESAFANFAPRKRPGRPPRVREEEATA